MQSQTVSSKKGPEVKQFVTMTIGHQIFGISVGYIVDILFQQKINPIPLSRQEIIGSLNLRGRIVTALDIRTLLGISDKTCSEKNMCVVVDCDSELFSLMVDKVGDVVHIPADKLVKNPDNLNKLWQEVSLGIFPMEDDLLVILDIEKVIIMLMG